MKWKSFFKRIMIFVLALTIINSTITSSVALSTMSLLKLYDSEVETNTSVDETNQTEENTNKNTLQTQPGGGTVFQDDAINIYNIAQLKAIGTNKIVYENDGDATTFGTGNVVVDNDNNVVTYSLSANYRLMNDIPLNINDLWQLPEDFTGKFVSEDITENPVYDKTSDTMYVYHSYQLQTIASSTSNKEPVMSKDANPELYGMGQLTYIDDNNYVTYSKEHNYVLSKLFTGTRPSMISSIYATNDNAKNDAQKAGRDHVGQVYKEINGKKYILIGNEQQLRAIGTGKQVTPMLFVRTKVKFLIGLFEDVTIIPYYPGDADLNITKIDDTGINYEDIEDKTKDFQYLKQHSGEALELWNPDFDDSGLLEGVVDILGKVLDGILGIIGSSKSEIVGLKDENTSSPSIGKNKNDGWLESKVPEYESFDNIKERYKDLKYTSDANYIIFRDIDLSTGDFSNSADDPWTPLMFSGTMIGAKATEPGGLWEAVTNEISNETNQVTISNILINQSGEIDTDKQSGIGFFASIYSEPTDKLGSNHKDVIVKNLKLNNVSVNNQSDKIEDKTGLIELLVEAILIIIEAAGSIVGAIVPSANDVTNALNMLLNPDGSGDPTVFATGAFAGRINGKVTVENCTVSNLTNINNVKDITGGFVGNVEGNTVYGTLQETLGSLVGILEKILGMLPLLDLDTLLKVLVDGGVITIDKLVPTGYENPVINNCNVINSETMESKGDLTITSLKTNKDGLETTDTNANYKGGFAGRVIGAEISNSTVKVPSLTITGNRLIGGFAGFTANAELVGVLKDVGVELFNTPLLNSYILNCNVYTDALDLTAIKDYAGGITGILANSYSVNNGINAYDGSSKNSNIAIEAGSYAGGITGRATIGQAITLGGDEEIYTGNNTLLKLVGDILSKVTSGDETAALLSLAGTSSSVVAGNTIFGNLNVTATNDYAGGLIGFGEAVKVISPTTLVDESLKDNDINVAVWSKIKDKLHYQISENSQNRNVIEKLKVVEGKSYIGGLIGRALVASPAGILNHTLGLANYLPFIVENTDILAGDSGYNVIASENYAGGVIGQGIGGSIDNINVNNINTVSAKNYAGGFVASAGTGNLLNLGDGLNVLGLDLIKINNLLSLAEAVSFNANNCTVSGISDGFTVKTTGDSTATSADLSYYAGGFVGENSSSNLTNCSVNNLKYVSSDEQKGRAGGFAAEMSTGGLAGIAEDSNEIKLPGILNVEGLISAVQYLIPKYQNCNVAFVSNNDLPQVEGAIAGGFIGNMGAGTVDNSGLGDSRTVSGLEKVLGTYYAGGFAGKATAGGFVNSGNGIKLLGVINLASLSNLLNVLEVYVPKIINADVSSSATGLVVKASSIDSKDANSGSAGGFVGFGSSVQISDSDVNGLRYIDLASKLIDESVNSKKYYEDTLQYAVDGQRNAGGYAGKIDIGSVANAVDGLDVLDQKISLTNLAEVLDVTSSRIENSDVKGAPGGYSVRANGKADSSIVGNAGGYVGAMYGSALQNSNVSGFEYIVGQETAGGYAGRIEPGNVANVIEDTSILDGVANVSNLLSAIRTFIPMIYNSKTSGVLCGGYVIANGESNNGVLRGTAGGYVGYNLGGRIEGNSSREWKNVVDGTPVIPGENTAFELRKNSIERLRLVEGYEFAGGFTGKLETANIADAGSLNLLFGLIKASNLLGVLSVVYPEESNTSVDGPLTNVTVEEWKAWKEAIGNNGVYGDKFNEISDNLEQDALNEKLANYKYGYKVKAGRTTAATLAIQGGVAGGYVGRMDGGKITEGNAADLKSVTAYRNSGGFAGEIMSADVANIGGIAIGNINVIGNLGLLNDFVPIIKNSSITGYKSGATITTKGTDHTNFQGNAGGFVGKSEGGQIDYAEANNIKTVKGTNAIGGFAGSIIAGSAADVNTEANSGLLNAILGSLIDTSGNLATVLQATLPTVKHAKVTGVDNSGLFVDGRYNYDSETNSYDYAKNAGGFAGFVIGAIIGDKDATNVNENNTTDASVQVKNLVKVTGGEHAGGFLGLGDVSAVAQVGDSQDTSLAAKILDLIKLGNIDVLDVFRPYIYNAKVIGLNDRGFNVNANTVSSSGTLDSKVYIGNAGGFAGSLLNGTAKDSAVVNLASVNAKAYGGGFIGHMGKSGAVDIDQVGTGNALEGLLNGTVGVLDVFGSYADNCLVKGIENGFTVKSLGAKEHFGSTEPDYDGQAIEVAGGFVGNGDLARISASNVKSLRQVSSGQIAGGFIGRSSFEYLAKIQVNDILINFVLNAVEELIRTLYLDELQGANVINIDLGIIKLDALYDGNTLSLDLLGLKISVALSKSDNGQTDVAIIQIGDSEIKLPCNENGFINDETTNIEVNLIKANRTRVKDSSVAGIDIGYDVFAGGATNKKDGTDINGYAGGFVGLNHEGLLDNNKMIMADTIRGTANKIGEFSGTTTLESTYEFNTVYGIEGDNNTYQVYRLLDNDNLTKICIGTEGDKILVGNSTEAQISGTNYYLYDVVHLNVNGVGAPSLDGHDNWKNAYQTAENESVRIPLNVYVSEAQADLMLGTPTGEIVTDPSKEDDLAQDPCSQDAFITIQKRWIDDNNSSGDRDLSINVTIIKKKEDGSQISMPITMDSSMANADENSWSIVKELPMFYKKEDGSTGKYTYEVVEDTIDGYLTIYDQSEDGYTFYITNYRTTSIMDGDSVVIDYGLPVVVDVMENDRIANDSELQGTLTGVTKINRDGETDGVNSEVYSQDAITSKLWTEDEANAASCTGNYGKAEIDAEDKNSIRYTPTNMQMDNFEKLLYAVKVNGKTKNDQNYVYSTLDIIPATQIYYEDNFKTVKYNDGKDNNGTDVKWQVEGTTDENRTQDVNRPGMRQITKALDNGTEKTYDVNYGFDTSYINDNTFGDGSAHYVVVDKNTKKTNFPSLEFTFTGTGFDVISLTNNQTGTIIARVYKVDENGDVAENAKPIRSWVVDTYYGYRFDKENKEWVIDNTVDTPLYQVPIIRSDDNSMGPLDYGTYKVTITLTYSSIIDNTDDNEIPNGYKYYFDGVRIYGSANKNNSDYQVIEDAYIADHENNPEYLEIRDMLIAHGEDPTLEEVPKPGFGFIDGSISEVTLSDYINYGPKHETYLKPGQAISFYLESDYKPDAVHIGAKVASGSNLNLGLYLMNRENDTWVPYKERTDIVLNSTGELFRDLSNQCVWEEVEVAGQTKYRTRYPIVICNNEQPSVQDENNGFQDIISLTQIKLTGKPTNTTTEELGFRVYSNYDSVEAAYSVVRSQFEKKITVKYVDLNGNSITQDEIKKVEVNKTYDVSDLANKEINGYSIVEVKGDVTGTADSDKEVTVVYGKNYQLKVNYVDLQGNQLEKAYVEKTVEGNTYDLTEASKQEIDGYSIVEVKGDVTGTADSNKEVTVVYGKNYQLKVNYVDLQGNQLEKAYVEKTVEGNTYDLTEASKQEISGYSIVEVKGDVTGTADSNKEVTVVYGKNYQLIVQYLDENGNKLAKDYTVTGIEGNRYDLSLQVNVKINGYEFDKVIGDLITGIIDQDKVVKVLYIKETNSDMTNNDSNKPNQDHTMDNNNITSLKTGDDINITFALIGLCLSILMGWVFIRKSKKFKDE